VGHRRAERVVRSFGEAVVERVDVVCPRLRVEEVLEFGQLVGVLCGEVVGLGESSSRW